MTKFLCNIWIFAIAFALVGYTGKKWYHAAANDSAKIHTLAGPIRHNTASALASLHLAPVISIRLCGAPHNQIFPGLAILVAVLGKTLLQITGYEQLPREIDRF